MKRRTAATTSSRSTLRPSRGSRKCPPVSSSVTFELNASAVRNVDSIAFALAVAATRSSSFAIRTRIGPRIARSVARG